MEVSKSNNIAEIVGHSRMKILVFIQQSDSKDGVNFCCNHSH